MRGQCLPNRGDCPGRCRISTVRYLRCDLPGLDRARNLALHAAEHPVVAFCDDDVQVDPGWLRALLRNYADPHVQCVTGLVLPQELATPSQEAFERFSPVPAWAHPQGV